MKILYLTDNASVHNKRFLEKLISAGHEVWSWNLTSTGLSGNELPSSVHTVLSERAVSRGASPGEYRELLPQLQSLLGEIEPALVHAGPIQSGGYLAALADFHPLLLMSWGSDLLLDAERNFEWKQATEFALRKADAFFCDCDAVRKRAGIFRRFSDSQVVQFPWGVKNGVFSPAGPLPSLDKFARKPGATAFLYTRSYDPLYRTDVLFEAFARARKMDSSLHLVLIGNGSQDQGVRDYVCRYDLSDAVSLLGPQPDEELPRWYRAADGYISCAQSDGTSVSLLEAMATGLPVIVTDIPSNREWVKEPTNGWLAHVGSTESLAQKLLAVANLSPEERKAISDRNRSVIAARGDWDQNFPRLLGMYLRLTDRSR